MVDTHVPAISFAAPLERVHIVESGGSHVMVVDDIVIPGGEGFDGPTVGSLHTKFEVVVVIVRVPVPAVQVYVPLALFGPAGGGVEPLGFAEACADSTPSPDEFTAVTT